MDLETTGLDPRRDVILSIGWVPIRRRHVVLSESGYVEIRADRELQPESVIVHGITDDRAERGQPLEDTLGRCFRRWEIVFALRDIIFCQATVADCTLGHAALACGSAVRAQVCANTNSPNAKLDPVPVLLPRHVCAIRPRLYEQLR